jgi:hypothetical protein
LEAQAVSELQGISRIKLGDRQLEDFKRLAAEIMDMTRRMDAGTLQLDMYFNDDESECVVLERYKDSGALMEHAGHLGDLGQALQRMGSVSGELLGEPSAELKTMMAGGPVRVFTLFESL